ncbi:MAG: UPF0158 family protein [Phycisphaeraceae bacterium]
MSKTPATAASLKEVIDALQMQGEMASSYIHKHDGRIVELAPDGFDEDDDADEEDLDDWQIEARAEARMVAKDDAWIALPDQFEINEYRIMEDFIDEVEPQRDAEILANSIRGSGAFRRFKDMVNTMGIEKDWYAFLNQAMARIAARFLDVNEIPWKNDVPGFVRDGGGSTSKENSD